METYHGRVLSPADAIILFEACRLGTLPRVQRRLSEKERQSIKAGSVFVWDEREAGMRRWTDGKSWSASRVSGSFLTYREMEGKRGGNSYGSALGRAGRTPESTKGSDSDVDGAGEEGPDGYRYKPDGLMKSSFSITTTTGNHLHLISYHPRQGPVGPVPSQDPALRHIRPPKGLYPESSINDQTSIPAVTRTPMATPPVSHIVSNAYQRSGPPMYPPPPGAGWSHPASVPQAYGPYPPTSVPPPPQHFTPVPLAYPQPVSASPMAVLGQVYQSARTHTPPIDGTTRLPPVLGHHRNGSSDSHHNGYSSNPSYPRPGPVSNHSRSGSPSNSSITSRTDPRLIAPSPLTQDRILPGLLRDSAQSHTRTPSPAPRRDFSATPTSRDTALSSASVSTIPSIGALVHGALEHEARSRSQSRSPASNHRSINGPQDIPHSKIAFGGEDMRALRVLDRAFKT